MSGIPESLAALPEGDQVDPQQIELRQLSPTDMEAAFPLLLEIFAATETFDTENEFRYVFYTPERRTFCCLSVTLVDR